MAIGASPDQIFSTAESLAYLADELAHQSGYTDVSLQWYGDRAVISTIYIATELHLLTDSSDDFTETWAFLERRLDEAER